MVANHTWSTPGAYPAFDPPEDFAPFTLCPGLYYAAALENAASAMEIAGGRGGACPGGCGCARLPCCASLRGALPANSRTAKWHRAALGHARACQKPPPHPTPASARLSAAIEGRMAALLTAQHLRRRGAADAGEQAALHLRSEGVLGAGTGAGSERHEAAGAA